ncbi:sigma-70 family RNA polymerase sigma factor [Planctomycetaceae bacterium SH139]
MTDVTRLLRAVDEGDQKAAEELLPVVYNELRRLAQSRLSSEKTGQTLQATDLVHEAYQRLVGNDGDEAKWNGTGHFFGAAAEAMRRILIESARAKAAIKRGGDRQRVKLQAEIEPPAAQRPERLLELDDALRQFEQYDAEKAKVVKLRFFAGLTSSQTAKALGVSVATVERNWAYARAWLKTTMDRDANSEA